ncbi:Crp/Fnr family transcriptional regulator [Flavobacterium defluvii]|uniref:cAMP-binding domain of CRP or a regulatory subunit of cAMP-dependent protein kinases n=1 Tax=Flavobacterium defluvii TaxID=370979 RepID=A0A1M5W7C0_9FLAO|nr:Crp/Fnr family transcriptional regulator [Flavobacterium defluvii]SHH83365.1 cAMP-binding domain of CRP or a regulatory subunit of cAMP-dependent protein kinases [Flavobacterium defluvii]
MEEFIEYILQFGNLNQQQIDLVLNNAIEIELKKDEYFSEAGKVSQQVGFVLNGVLRVCYYNNKGEEITKYFIDENNLVVDFESFENEIPSTVYVQAAADTKIMVFPRKNWKELSNIIVGWDAIVHKIVSRALMQKVERRSPLISEDAKTRYLKFLEIYPNIVNRVPLSFVASYLGITQSSLSRIRKNIQ